MTTTAEPDPVTALFSPGGADEPHHAYADIRDRCPVARHEFGGTPNAYISRYEDVLWAMRHPEVFSSDAEALPMGEQPLIPLQVDPPLHTQYRRLLNPEFLPRTVARLEDQVRDLAAALVDGFASEGRCDFHNELATPLPSTVFLALMGLPQADLATFLRWRDNTIRPDVEPGDFEAADRIRVETGKAINAYFEEALDGHRAAREPDESLMSHLVHAEIDGRRMTQTELLGICHLMLLGGLDTVTATLDCMVVYLARHPDRRRAVVEDPSLLPSAIEELLRHESPVMLVPRIVTREVTLQGVELRPGDHVTLMIGAANADQAEFPDGDVDFARDPNKHLAFGGGHHLCLGAHLARLELRVGLEEFHRRIPEYRIADGAEIHFSPGIRQADQLPLVFPT